MGVDTLAVFRDMLNLSLGDKAQANERLDVWINAAIEELFSLLDSEGRRAIDTFVTVIDQEAYVLPDTIIAILSLKDLDNDKRILKLPFESFELRDRTRTGTSRYYSRVDQQLFLHPIPDSVISIRRFFIKSADRLVLPADVSELPSMFDRVIQLLAQKNAMMDLGLDEKATFRYQSAVNMFRSLPTEEWLEAQAATVGVEVARSEADLR